MGMKLGRYEIRKPFVRYVDIPFEKEVYLAMQLSILENLVRETQEKINEGK
jgi:hypothetical protein